MGALTVVLMLVAAEPAWKQLDGVPGVTVSVREVPNERFSEFRVTAVSSLGVDALCTAAFGTAQVDPEEAPISSIISRKLVRETRSTAGVERITYEQLTPPIVSARDFAVRNRMQPLAGGGCRVTINVANEFAPPLPAGFTRIEKIRGGWDVVPEGTSSRVTYTIFTDPNVSVPVGLVEGSLGRSAVGLIQLVLRRAHRPISTASRD